MRLLSICLVLMAFAGMDATQVAAATASVWYTYDPTGRIKTARYDNGLCIAYRYDANGNRTIQSNFATSAGESPIWGAGEWGCFVWTTSLAETKRRISRPASHLARLPGPDGTGR